MRAIDAIKEIKWIEYVGEKDLELLKEQADKFGQDVDDWCLGSIDRSLISAICSATTVDAALDRLEEILNK
jgi:hypothetical protein